ncbi:hypothetical protein J1G42_14525 [Cellulomonas sp. zg-ZUI222]|uniref:Asparagine synthetase domain-containing protein n=1 Tax=Cellulomonas wangleii TaxID=2816956 RepID=A0ABX8D5M4_9CELL|nr:asparagine synthase-related protein [Cellulomonas wangleii]MBO0922037.1 hypothetical protein [Cellulomonas wangleii]MBO0926245.1 hypothetical protein [Cellulomonas wangleii]QVI62751.1 hypothetical protein KG103_02075 [Cellulomonas wangleii]
MSIVVLPDRPVPPDLAAALAAQVGKVLFRHPSGNAWLVGDTGGRRVVSARVRDLDVVVTGDDAHGTDERSLRSWLEGATSVDRLDAGRLTEGDVVLFARSHGRMRSQAPLFLTRSLCWTMVAGVPVISDEQLTLQRLAELRPDPAVLASRLTDAEISLPVGLRSIWAGVHSLRPGEWWHSLGSDAPRAVRWWSPPAPDRSLEELTDVARDAMRAALATRTDHRRDLSADLSGGLDSTTLSFFLADSGRPPHHTLFLSSQNVANGDHVWAERAASELGTNHLVLPYDSVLPRLVDATTGTLVNTPEGPSIASVSAAAVPMLEDALAGTGSSLHLNGHAGDALFGPVTTILWSLLRSGAKGRVRQVWRQRLANRYPVVGTFRTLAQRGTYADDLARVARADFDRPESELADFSRWVAMPRVHPALTGVARDHLRGLAAQEMAEGREPYSPDRTTHQIVQYLSVHGADVRRINQARTPGAGLLFDSPYLDRRIVDACLALSIDDRARQYPVKPLLAAARPAGMSLDYFTRADKGDYSAEVFSHHRAAAPMLRELFSSGSALEDLGLIDPGRIMRAVDGYSVDGAEYRDLDQIAFTERWLRSLADPPPSGARARTREGELTSSG